MLNFQEAGKGGEVAGGFRVTEFQKKKKTLTASPWSPQNRHEIHLDIDSGAVCCLPTSCSLGGLCPLGTQWQWLSMHAFVSLFLVCAHDQPSPHVKYTQMGLSE